MKDFAHHIMKWYYDHKRDLPWRQTKDPYKIWLSEIILQQTKVEQGLPYYLKFVERFPTVETLANAKEEEVLKLWQGLGYYSRARNLHVAANQILLKGSFPSSFQELLELKGVGVYTAAAIASFAFGEKVAVVDGNVYRVLARYFALRDPIDTGKGQKRFFELANLLIDPEFPGDYNQSIMEFGALQCTPKTPLCHNCPLEESCESRSTGGMLDFPVKAKKIKRRNRYFLYLYCKDEQGRLAVVKREGKDVWQNMYELPFFEFRDELEMMSASKGFSEFIDGGKISKHVLSHQDIYYRVISCTTKSLLKHDKAGEVKFLSTRELKEIPVPKLLENYLL